MALDDDLNRMQPVVKIVKVVCNQNKSRRIKIRNVFVFKFDTFVIAALNDDVDYSQS